MAGLVPSGKRAGTGGIPAEVESGRRPSMQQDVGATATTESVLGATSLRGRRILVTGVSAGLGIETARALAARGAQVVGTARDLAKAEAATGPVRDAAWNSGGRFRVEALDLASLAATRACADRLLDRAEPFDLVIANAGVMATPFGRTADGFETQFGTNHLGHFVLVNRIVPLLREGARVGRPGLLGPSLRRR